jgi:FMN reductase
MTSRIVGLAGSWSVPSRTRALVALIGTKAAARFGAAHETYALNDLGPSLGQARALEELDAPARAIVDRLLSADALIVGTPVYKGSYTGLFKHLFDLIEPSALAAKPVLLTATGGGDKHALVVEHHLRPLFGFFEAATLPTGIYAGSADFLDAVPASPALLGRIDRAVEQLAPWLATRAPSALAATA